MDIEKVTKAIEANAGEALPDLRQALEEAKARVGCVTTPAQILVRHVVPIDIWNRVKDAVEDAEDIADLERFDREDDGAHVPFAVVEAQVNGARPVRAWREHRGLTQDALSEASGHQQALPEPD